jgi:hypothetical protein
MAPPKTSRPTNASTPTPSAPRPTLVRPCTRDALTVTMGNRELFTGHLENVLVVNNNSPHGCWVRRTPRVVLTDSASRSSLRLPQRHRAARTQLAADTADIFGIVFLNQGAFTPPECPTASLHINAITMTLSPRVQEVEPLSAVACPVHRREPGIVPLQRVRAGHTDGLVTCGRLRANDTEYGPSMTGEDAHTLRLTNTGHRTCLLDGHPTITAVDRAGRTIPFDVVHGGQYASHHRPEPVILNPAGHAFVLVAKYRCDAGEDRRAVALRLRVSPSVTVDVHLDRFPDFSSCQGHNVIGNTVDVSPYAATSAAADRAT